MLAIPTSGEEAKLAPGVRFMLAAAEELQVLLERLQGAVGRGP
jgi:hypothetical protein